MALPACAALRVHVPTVTSVTVAPLVPVVVHTFGVNVLKVTASDDDALALTVNVGVMSERSGSAAKVIVCDAGIIRMLAVVVTAA